MAKQSESDVKKDFTAVPVVIELRETFSGVTVDAVDAAEDIGQESANHAHN